MGENTLLDYLQSLQATPTVQDMHLLAPYLFNLSNAVKQGTERNIRSINGERREGDPAEDILARWAVLARLASDELEDGLRLRATTC